MTFDVVGFGALNLDKLFKVNMIAKRRGRRLCHRLQDVWWRLSS